MPSGHHAINDRNLAAWRTPPTRVAHPARLSAMAQLVGASPRASACHYLHLGSGDGGHLFGLAANYPESTFVGVEPDDALRSVAQDVAERAELTNLSFENESFLDRAEARARFDFVVWLEGFTVLASSERHARLRQCGGLLNEGGVALVGYEVLPGARPLRVARDVLRRAVSDSERASAGEVRGALDWLREAPAGGRGIELLRPELDALFALDDDVLLRAFRAKHEPVLFRDFHTEAAEAGLHYLGEAGRNPVGAGFAQARAFLKAQGDPIEHEQYVDILSGRHSRRSLLVKAAPPAKDELDQRLCGLWCLSPLQAVSSDSQTFVAPGGAKVQVGSHQLGALLRGLGRRFPEAIPCQDLAAQLALETGGLTALVLEAYELELVDMMDSPTRCATSIAGKPMTSNLTRLELELGMVLTSSLHFQVRPRSGLTKALIPLLDGTRTRDTLLAELRANLPDLATQDLPRLLQQELEQLTRQALLVEV